LYQLEYHMKTSMKSPFVRPSAAVATAAALAFWFTFGGAQMVRAEDPETLSPPGQDMVLVPAKTINELQQRVIYLEETVAALTESWQHIDTHRLCVSDDGGAETCVTKAQLDLVLNQMAQAEISQPEVSQEAKASTPAEPVEIAATKEPSPTEPVDISARTELSPTEPAAIASTTEPSPSEPVEIAARKETSPSSEPTTVVGEKLPDQDPEFTGTVKSASTGDAVLALPKVEPYEEPAAQSDN
jgi:hypothetical protein